MANEIRVSANLRIDNGNLQFQSRPAAFQADMAESAGPTPGSISVATAGTDVDLDAITTPGMMFVMNQEDAGGNYVEGGIWDGVTFYPLFELLPGEFFVFRLARNLTQEYGTGSGTTGAPVNSLRMKANTAAVQVLIQAFGK